MSPVRASPEIEHLKGINGDTASDGDVTQFSPLETVIVVPVTVLEVKVTDRALAERFTVAATASVSIVWLVFVTYPVAEAV